MRFTTPIALGASLAALTAFAPLAAAQGTHTTYDCNSANSNYTACAVIENQVDTFVGPGRLSKSRPLVFLNKTQLPCYMFQARPYYWDAQEKIPAGGRGAAQIDGSLCAGGAINYGMVQGDGPQNYQAIVGFRVDSNADLQGCIASTYLACRMGPEQDYGRDSRRAFTVTSRPLEVKILNTLPNALRRMDGPYWSAALGAAKADNAGVVAASTGVGYMGALRSVVATSGMGAIYKLMPGTDDTRFDGGTVAIDIKVGIDGTRSGKCTPVYAPSWKPFNCSLEFSGTNAGTTIATIRVRP